MRTVNFGQLTIIGMVFDQGLCNTVSCPCYPGMCLLFKTVVLSNRSNNRNLKYSKWKEKALKNAQKPL